MTENIDDYVKRVNQSNNTFYKNLIRGKMAKKRDKINNELTFDVKYDCVEIERALREILPRESETRGWNISCKSQTSYTKVQFSVVNK